MTASAIWPCSHTRTVPPCCAGSQAQPSYSSGSERFARSRQDRSSPTRGGGWGHPEGQHSRNNNGHSYGSSNGHSSNNGHSYSSGPGYSASASSRGGRPVYEAAPLDELLGELLHKQSGQEYAPDAEELNKNLRDLSAAVKACDTHGVNLLRDQIQQVMQGVEQQLLGQGALQGFDRFKTCKGAMSLAQLAGVYDVLPLGLAFARRATTEGFMQGVSVREWAELLYGLAKCGLTCPPHTTATAATTTTTASSSSAADTAAATHCSQGFKQLIDAALPSLTLLVCEGAFCKAQDVSNTALALRYSGYGDAARAAPFMRAVDQYSVMTVASPQEWANLLWAVSG